MLPLGVPAGLGQLVRLRPVDPAEVGEEQQPVVGRRGEEVVDHVLAAQLRPADALAAPALRAVLVDARALGVPPAGDRDDDLLLRDEVLHRHVAEERVDPGAAVVAVLVGDDAQLLADDRPLPLGRGEDRVVVLDQRLQLLEPVDDLLPLQGRQPAQLHVEDRGGLDLVDVEQLDQAVARHLDRGRRPDESDDLVERVEGLEVAAQDVRLFLGLAQAVARAALDDLELVLDPVPDEAVQRQGPRHAVDQRQHVGAEVVLQLGVLVEVVQHDLGDRVALEHDDEALARTAGALVTDVRDAADLPVLDQLGDLQRQVVRVHLVGQLGHHEAGAVLDLLDRHDRPHRDRPTAGPVGVLDAAPAHDQRAGREVRAGDERQEAGQQLLVRGLRVVAGTTARRRRPRAGCAAGCWSPCRPRCRTTR